MRAESIGPVQLNSQTDTGTTAGIADCNSPSMADDDNYYRLFLFFILWIDQLELSKCMGMFAHWTQGRD